MEAVNMPWSTAVLKTCLSTDGKRPVCGNKGDRRMYALTRRVYARIVRTVCGGNIKLYAYRSHQHIIIPDKKLYDEVI